MTFLLRPGIKGLTTAAISADSNTTGANSATFKITNAKLYVPVVTVSAEQLSEGLKSPVYWNKYKVIDNKKVEIIYVNYEENITELLDSSYQGVKRSFVLKITQQVINKFLLILSKNFPSKCKNRKLRH